VKPFVRRDQGDSLWAPLADTMTLVSCVFLVVFLGSVLAYREADRKRNEAVKVQAEKDAQLRQLLDERRQNTAAAEAALAAAVNAARGTEIELGADRRNIQIASDALFDTNSAVVRPEVRDRIRTALASAIATAVEIPGHVIVIAGHADAVPVKGDKFGNWDLSTRRAVSVLSLILDARPDIPANRVLAVGYGDTRPLPGRPPSASENRRVEISAEPMARDLISGTGEGSGDGAP
jgi:flagellar motor protein MotB